MRNLLKTIALACTFFLFANVGQAAFASTVDKSNEESFTIDFQGNEVKYTLNRLSVDEIEITTITNGEEKHEAYIDKKNKTIKLDGEEVKIKEERFVDPNLVKSNLKSNGSITIQSDAPGGGGGSNWTPVYQYSNRLNYSQVVSSIGNCATVIGAVITLGSWAGVSIATSAIATKIAGWASVSGLGTLVGGSLMSGYVRSDTYKTIGLVPTGYGRNLYAYRYQNIGSYFTLMGKVFNDSFKEYGDWWFAEKPY